MLKNLKNVIAGLNKLSSTTKTSCYENLENKLLTLLFKLNAAGLFTTFFMIAKKFH